MKNNLGELKNLIEERKDYGTSLDKLPIIIKGIDNYVEGIFDDIDLCETAKEKILEAINKTQPEVISMDIEHGIGVVFEIGW